MFNFIISRAFISCVFNTVILLLLWLGWHILNLHKQSKCIQHTQLVHITSTSKTFSHKIKSIKFEKVILLNLQWHNNLIGLNEEQRALPYPPFS